IQSCMSIDHKTTDAQVLAQLKQIHGITLLQNTVNKARNAVIGSAKAAQQEEFRYIEAWLIRLSEKDPGAVTEHVTVDGTFTRTFLSPGPARRAWTACKPFMAVDGTFTKNKFNMSSSTIISDRQKGLIAAVRAVLPNTTEGYCCWNLAENVKKGYGAEARKLLWPLVYAPTKAKFDTCMTALRSANPEQRTT
ncbi:unnamed protein product, partial [Tilletia controversa]